MARKFDIPLFYRSPVISTVKRARRLGDHRKQDLTPTVLDLGEVRFKIARHFGFCFGVENAIEIAYRALAENEGKRVYLLSEMIHNPQVNGDLIERGVRFILAPDGTQLVPFEELTPDDIVIVPAFGTTVELFKRLSEIGIDPRLYNTTCPFVEKVWKRAGELGERGFTVIIHGKHYHEETRATFSHSQLSSPSLVIRDLKEARLLGEYITGARDLDQFSEDFDGRFSDGFNPEQHLTKIGVVNQTTMLAAETQEISNYLRSVLLSHYGAESITDHFADTRDTLCYATNENQAATYALIESGGDLAVVVGGYNSSNTSHLVKLCADKFPTYYIKDSGEILDSDRIQHLDLQAREVVVSSDWLPKERPLDILITAGASCPDAVVDQVLTKICSFLGTESRLIDALAPFLEVLERSGEQIPELSVVDLESELRIRAGRHTFLF